jgi:hypothetical protein
MDLYLFIALMMINHEKTSLYLLREECGWPVNTTFGIIGALKQIKNLAIRK